jgi:hypothetical protein
MESVQLQMSNGCVFQRTSVSEEAILQLPLPGVFVIESSGRRFSRQGPSSAIAASQVPYMSRRCPVKVNLALAATLATISRT